MLPAITLFDLLNFQTWVPGSPTLVPALVLKRLLPRKHAVKNKNKKKPRFYVENWSVPPTPILWRTCYPKTTERSPTSVQEELLADKGSQDQVWENPSSLSVLIWAYLQNESLSVAPLSVVTVASSQRSTLTMRTLRINLWNIILTHYLAGQYAVWDGASEGSTAQLLLHPVGAHAAAHSASPSTNVLTQLHVPCWKPTPVTNLLSAVLTMSHYSKNHEM